MTCHTCGQTIPETEARITEGDGRVYHVECYPTPEPDSP